MTREEAMEILDKMPLCNECDSSNFPYTCVECGDAFLMATEALKQPEIVRCKDCLHAEQTMFDDEYCCYYDEENESGCKRLHKGNFFCADGKQG